MFQFKTIDSPRIIKETQFISEMTLFYFVAILSIIWVPLYLADGEGDDDTSEEPCYPDPETDPGTIH
jgi:hypothetical protein